MMRSPLYAHFSESVNGVATIRAFEVMYYDLGSLSGLCTKKTFKPDVETLTYSRDSASYVSELGYPANCTVHVCTYILLHMYAYLIW